MVRNLLRFLINGVTFTSFLLGILLLIDGEEIIGGLSFLILGAICLILFKFCRNCETKQEKVTPKNQQ